MRRPLAAAGALLLALSLALLLYAALRGEASLALLFVIPILTITGPVGAVGALLLPAAILLLFLSLLPERGQQNAVQDSVTGSRWGGVVMIGPIPILFGSARGSRRAFILAVLASTLIMAALLLILLL